MTDADPKRRPLRVAIIGSGPAGFYAADAFFKQKAVAVEVDIFDRLPTPYGLVRGGVAPDHPKIKAVVHVYERAAHHPGFRFLGNVELGRHVQVGELREHYDLLFYAVGNEASRRLGIPGEGIPGCTPATVFVGWYNGHPDYRRARLDLRARRVAVVGNGNVALDVARILARDPGELDPTDIAAHALAALKESRVEEIFVLGRRGPVQAAFTPAELKELGALRGVATRVAPHDLELDAESAAELAAADRRTRLNLERLGALAGAETKGDARRRVHLRFLVSPREISAGEDGRVAALHLERNRLVRRPDGRLAAEGTGELERLAVDLVPPAIGFRATPIAGVPFDERRAVITNRDGRVWDAAGDAPVPGEYVVGWARSGAQGLIGTHKGASAEVVARAIEDVRAGTIARRRLPPGDALPASLAASGHRVVTFDDWQVLDRVERVRGERRDAPREKITAVDEMLAVIDEA